MSIQTVAMDFTAYYPREERFPDGVNINGRFLVDLDELVSPDSMEAAKQAAAQIEQRLAKRFGTPSSVHVEP